MVNTDSYQLLIEKLQSLVDRAMSLDVPKPFFLTLFEYVDTYDKDERLNPVMRAIAKLKENDLKKENELAELAKVEMRQAYQKLSSSRNNPKFQNIHFFQEGLQHFEAYERENGSIDSSAGPIAGRHGCLLHALISIPIEEPELKEFVSLFGDKDAQGNIIKWNFAPSYYLWDAEEKYVQRLLPTKVWHSWDKLVSFYSIFRDYEKIRDDKIKKKEIFSTLGLDMVFQELNDIMNYKEDKKRYLREFDVGEYKVHLQRVFNHTREIILAEVVVKNIQKTTNTNTSYIYTFDDVASILSINGRQVKFKKDTRKLTMLKLLLKKPKGIYYDEVTQELEGASADGLHNPKNTYYEVCRGIYNSLARVGITDFIQYDFNQAKINPLYKKLRK